MRSISGVWFSALAVLAFAGCSSGGGSSTLFPTGHYLLGDARQMAKDAPQPAPVSRELSKSVLPDYFVQPGDVLLIEPVDFDAELRLPADQTVLADGTLDLGRFGRIVVAGLTLEQIESEVYSVIRQAEPDQDAAVNVRLIDPQGALYYVLGEVNSPGSFPLIGRETVLDGLMAAGGVSERSALCAIVLSRPTGPCDCRVVLPVCYREIVQLGDTTTNYQLRPGDRIFVSTKTIWDDLKVWQNRKSCPVCQSVQCACRTIRDVPPGAEFHEFPTRFAPPATPHEANTGRSDSRSDASQDDSQDDSQDGLLDRILEGADE